MTLFHSLEGRLYHPSPAARPLRGPTRRAFRRLKAGLRIMHRAIVVAKLRRIERELMIRKIPQQPLILDDKWDF
jgi:hypothetical protein